MNSVIKFVEEISEAEFPDILVNVGKLNTTKDFLDIQDDIIHILCVLAYYKFEVSPEMVNNASLTFLYEDHQSILYRHGDVCYRFIKSPDSSEFKADLVHARVALLCEPVPRIYCYNGKITCFEFVDTVPLSKSPLLGQSLYDKVSEEIYEFLRLDISPVGLNLDNVLSVKGTRDIIFTNARDWNLLHTPDAHSVAISLTDDLFKVLEVE